VEHDVSAEPAVPSRGRAGRPRAEDLEARHDAILDVAGRIFEDRGYRGTSLDMIAREARVAVRTIYVKFGGKAGLFTAVLQQRRLSYGIVDIGAADPGRAVRDVLQEFGEHLLELLATPQIVRMHRMVIAEAEDQQEAALIYYRTGCGHVLDMLASFFAREGMAATFKPGLLPAQLAELYFHCVCGDQITRLLLGGGGLPSGAQTAADVSNRLDLFYLLAAR
jgi:AcrR family transcriptional regulator